MIQVSELKPGMMLHSNTLEYVDFVIAVVPINHKQVEFTTMRFNRRMTYFELITYVNFNSATAFSDFWIPVIP